MIELVKTIIFFIGMGLVGLGAIFDLIGALGLLRFPNFFIRLHAATIGAIGGAVYPLIGVALMAPSLESFGQYRWYLMGGAIITALFIVLAAPTGSHALARATHRAKVVPVEPKIVDHLEEDKG